MRPETKYARGSSNVGKLHLEAAMRDRKPKSLWDELRRAFHGWMKDDEGEHREQASDPSFMFHVLFTAPLLLGLFAMMTRHA
jgi:hypothetical protein